MLSATDFHRDIPPDAGQRTPCFRLPIPHLSATRMTVNKFREWNLAYDP